jgi:hypothetical protein
MLRPTATHSFSLFPQLSNPQGSSAEEPVPEPNAVPAPASAMSWLARSIVATLSSPRGEPDSDGEDSEREPACCQRVAAPSEESLPRGSSRDPDAEEPEQPNTPSHGVKDDISELTDTITRRLWGVASFLAPPPESTTPRASAAAEAEDEEWKEEDGGSDGEGAALSPRVAGIRSDLAEIGGRVRSGISMLQNQPGCGRDLQTSVVAPAVRAGRCEGGRACGRGHRGGGGVRAAYLHAARDMARFPPLYQRALRRW